MYWGLGGWLLMLMIGKMGMERFNELCKWVVDNILFLFVSVYMVEVFLEEVLELDNIKVYV